MEQNITNIPQSSQSQESSLPVINKKKMSLRTKESLIGLAFVSIWLIGFLVFMAYPIIYSFYLSLNKVTIGSDGTANTIWYGFGNFKYAFTIDKQFLPTVWQYVSEIIISVPVIIVASLVLAMLLNTKTKGTGVFRTIFFLPVIITSGPVITQLINNNIIALTGVEDLFDYRSLSNVLPEVLADAIVYLIERFILILWFTGVQILIFMTGIQKLDKSMYEAAKIDGAGKWEIFWKLTLPAISPIIMINIVYTIVTQALWALNPIVSKINAERGNTQTGYGYASALSWLYFIIIVITLFIFLGLLALMSRQKKMKKAVI